ncbi:uncharacterized protein LOC115928676 [Strongylocentrotus purpuratus]|uniref:Uncharacterized protein n=1 Tax=Strongylocentrotus purpuratus TaxID=7668 RepID=A0A7M7PJ32_STRPU|nr:uncharacterized protein LOC115928676 [Strongylocentrotus purpuratus]XP_030852249.1 uncharacterized protein LOC115928676 [Strongylocentrotus purpuratus]
MMKIFLLAFAYMMCTISMAWGCVSGAGPSWEISQPGGRRPGPGGRPGPRPRPGVVGPEEPERPVGPSLPSIPVEVAKYFAGLVSKESAFASIDLDGNGLVCIQEWKLGGGAVTEFNYMLIRLDANGDKLISLAELQPFSVPTAPTKRTIENLDLPERLPRLPEPLPRLPEPLPRLQENVLLPYDPRRPRGPRGRIQPRK